MTDAESDTTMEPVSFDDADDCGCAARQEWLNERVPTLGDRVKVVADPIADLIGYKGRERKMPDLLKPDMKSLVWLAIGTFVVARFVRL